eukprot:gene8823-9768_t
MASFKFHTNPFSSQVGQRIERATDSSLPSEDWALFIEICDIINDTEDGAKDAVKAIKKRLSNKKDYKSLMYTLTLLESCVKNCGHRFHSLVVTKDVLEEMSKILGQKGIQNTQLPQVLKEKILSLIQAWADAFRNSEDLQAYVHYHDQLKAAGYDFPAQDIDNLAPIHTPKRSVPEPERRPQSAASVQPRAAPSAAQQAAMVAAGAMPVQRTNSGGGPINPTPTALAKLRSELNIVEENCRVMNEMLSTLDPHAGKTDDTNLLLELGLTCREMQKRIIELLEKIANDEVTGELLRVNDVLNNAFIRFDRFERNLKAVTSPVSTDDIQPSVGEYSAEMRSQPLAAQNGSSNLLIDFGGENTATNASQPAHVEDAEFDMFAQTRSSTFADSRKSGSTYEDNTTNVPIASFSGAISSKAPYGAPPSQEDKDVQDEIQDVAEWLKTTDLTKSEPTHAPATVDQAAVEPSQASGQEQSASSQPISSDEFDKFLTERSLSGPQRVSSLAQQQNQPPPYTATGNGGGAPRQMQLMAGDDKQDDQMFAL